MDYDNGVSYLATHKHVRRLVYVAAFLVVVAFMVIMFGQDRVAGWLEGGASSAGYEITSPEGGKP